MLVNIDIPGKENIYIDTYLVFEMYDEEWNELDTLDKEKMIEDYLNLDDDWTWEEEYADSY